ncbi:MAG: nuclear transport factor 2 family protein [Myxococcota bacterium]
MRSPWIVLLVGCGSSVPASSVPASSVPASSVPASSVPLNVDEERAAIRQVLDDWHDAASDADEERYFGHFTSDAVFLGTDATERWTLDEFRAYAHPHFERGRAWSFRATRRAVIVDEEGRLGWFDEELATEGLGPARGSGVVRNEHGTWRIAHYNLTLTVPNERMREVKELLAADPAPPSN